MIYTMIRDETLYKIRNTETNLFLTDISSNMLSGNSGVMLFDEEGQYFNANMISYIVQMVVDHGDKEELKKCETIAFNMVPTEKKTSMTVKSMIDRAEKKLIIKN